jgi:hypothetical protein
MKERHVLSLGMLAIFTLLSFSAVNQTNIAKAQIIKNIKTGMGREGIVPKINLLRTFGGGDVEDESYVFKSPYDVLCDSKGQIYILDSGNNRIQKYDANGKYIASIGRKGQGPGEFQYAFAFDIDSKDRLYVMDGGNNRIQIIGPNGKVEETIKIMNSDTKIRILDSGEIVFGTSPRIRDLLGGKTLPPLLEICDSKGAKITVFGEPTDFKIATVNAKAQKQFFDVDRDNNIVVSLAYQNRIDKYSPKGNLLWLADRELAFKTDVIDPGSVEHDDTGTSIKAARMNEVSMGIAADHARRYWVVTLARAMTERDYNPNRSGDDIKSDLYKLEIFRSDGILLGEIPLDHHAHGIRIFNDNVFIWEQINAIVFQYKIEENK